jgi:hypothetical protein
MVQYVRKGSDGRDAAENKKTFTVTQIQLT